MLEFLDEEEQELFRIVTKMRKWLWLERGAIMKETMVSIEILIK
jgi:hypothetical protein